MEKSSGLFDVPLDASHMSVVPSTTLHYFLSFHFMGNTWFVYFSWFS